MLFFTNKLSQRRISIIVIFQLIILGSFLVPASGQSLAKRDSQPPSVDITYPSFCSGIVETGTITVEGTASDSSGINRVEAFAQIYPQNDEDFPFSPAKPILPGDWSKWSIKLEIPDGKPYRILVRAIDNFGNENWDESLINSERSKENLAAIEDKSDQSRVAFVEPTFTNGAYNEDAFYFFYSKYQKAPEGQQITTDLNLMTGDIPFETHLDYFQPILDRVTQALPNSIVSVIGDEEINDGFIFRKDGTNAYDLLVLFHDEYVTQTEYDNLKKFLNNGGTIILTTGNVFFAEVLYDKELCIVTLKKGHNWEFDGRSVRKSMWERYLEDNREWFGSNFINNDMKDQVIFEKNPFNYKHLEENEVTNPGATILMDYQAKFLKIPTTEKNPLVVGGLLNSQSDQEIAYSDEGKKVATYELPSGTGKVIQMGIYSQNLATDPEFLNYFEKIILPRAIGNTYHFVDDDGEFDLFWLLPQGKLSDVVLDKESKSLSLKVHYENQSEKSQENYLTITLPKKLIDSVTSSKMSDYTVIVNGTNVSYTQTSDDIERGLTIAIPDDSEIRIVGTSVVPEFGPTEISMTVFLVALCSCVIIIKLQTNFQVPILRTNI